MATTDNTKHLPGRHDPQHPLDQLFAQAAETEMSEAQLPDVDERWLQLEARLLTVKAGSNPNTATAPDQVKATAVEARTRVLPIWWISIAASLLLVVGLAWFFRQGQQSPEASLAQTEAHKSVHAPDPSSTIKRTNSVDQNNDADSKVSELSDANIQDKQPQPDKLWQSMAKHQPEQPVQKPALQALANVAKPGPSITQQVEDVTSTPNTTPIAQVQSHLKTTEYAAKSDDQLEVTIEIRPTSKRDQMVAQLEPELIDPDAGQAEPDRYKTPVRQGSWFTRLNDIRKGRASLSAPSDSSRPSLIQRLGRQ
jgi:hypothetical protein